jgi:hypothetical protein
VEVNNVANYFRFFPTTFYTSDNNSKGVDTVTSIVSRFAIANNLRDNTGVFYPYDIQDTDTAEIIASKIYGNPERHWIVLSFNQVIDPQWDFPLTQDNFISYVNNKYAANGAANTPTQTGVTWALSENNIQAYFLKTSRTINAQNTVSSISESVSNTTLVVQTEVDKNTYANTTATSTSVFSLVDGSKVKEKTEKFTQSYYTYEFNKNEEKRKIKILKPEFVTELEKEFKRVFTR